MPTEKKENVLKVIVISLAFPLLYEILLIVVPIVSMFFYKYVLGTTEETWNSAKEIVTALASLAVFLLITFIIFKARHKSLLKRIRWNPAPQKSVYVFVALLGVAVQFINFEYLLPQSLMAGANNMVGSLGSQGLIVEIIVFGVIAPIGEEIIFRGLMMGRLKGHVASWLAVAFPALIFVLVHMGASVANAIGIIPTAVSLGLVFLWTNSIRAGMLVHIINNTIAFLLSSFLNNISNTLGLILIVPALLVAVLMLVMIYRRKQKGEPEIGAAKDYSA